MISTDKDYHKALKTLWNEYEQAEHALSESAYELLKRYYAVPKHIGQSDLLIAGINPDYDGQTYTAGNLCPSVRESLDKGQGTEGEKRFWNRVWNMVPENYRDRFNCIDLFGIRETDHDRLLTVKYPSDICFMAKHLYLTQQLIENVIQPKLIVVTDKSAWRYWGFDAEYGCMGYDCKVIREVKKNIILTEVQGLRTDDFGKLHMVTPTDDQYERRFALKGTLILFAPYQGTRCPHDQRVTAEDIRQILDNDCK